MTQVIKNDFIAKFKEQLSKTEYLQVASAWMTNNDALRCLFEKKQNRECFKLNAIIGTYGGATSKDSLIKVVKTFGSCSLRLAGGRTLFHPKLFIFHMSRGKSTAWIGSMNFTEGGLKQNDEIMLSTDEPKALKELEKWFNCEWDKRRSQCVRKEICEYHERDDITLRELVGNKGKDNDGDEEDDIDSEGIDSIQGLQNEENIVVRRSDEKAGRMYHGTIDYGSNSVDWVGYSELLQRLLVIISGCDEHFLAKLQASAAFEISNNGKLICSASNIESAKKKLHSIPRSSNPIRKICSSSVGKNWYVYCNVNFEQKKKKMIEATLVLYRRMKDENVKEIDWQNF